MAALATLDPRTAARLATLTDNLNLGFAHIGFGDMFVRFLQGETVTLTDGQKAEIPRLVNNLNLDFNQAGAGELLVALMDPTAAADAAKALSPWQILHLARLFRNLNLGMAEIGMDRIIVEMIGTLAEGNSGDDPDKPDPEPETPKDYQVSLVGTPDGITYKDAKVTGLLTDASNSADLSITSNKKGDDSFAAPTVKVDDADKDKLSVEITGDKAPFTLTIKAGTAAAAGNVLLTLQGDGFNDKRITVSLTAAETADGDDSKTG